MKRNIFTLPVNGSLHTIFQTIVRLGINCNCYDFEQKIEDLKTKKEKKSSRLFSQKVI